MLNCSSNHASCLVHPLADNILSRSYLLTPSSPSLSLPLHPSGWSHLVCRLLSGHSNLQLLTLPIHLYLHRHDWFCVHLLHACRPHSLLQRVTGTGSCHIMCNQISRMGSVHSCGCGSAGSTWVVVHLVALAAYCWAVSAVVLWCSSFAVCAALAAGTCSANSNASGNLGSSDL